MVGTESTNHPKTHQCPNSPQQGISLCWHHFSNLFREFPVWRLKIQRKATEADLEGNHHLEEIEESLWTTMPGVSHCPDCGAELPQH
jgi:hypothetical protein